MKIQPKAKEALQWFATEKRKEKEESVKIKAGRPKWVFDMTSEIGRLDNWKYWIMQNALEQIVEGNADPFDGAAKIAEKVQDSVDLLLSWLCSNKARMAMVDEARREWGPGGTLAEDITNGFLVEAIEIQRSVKEFLEYLLENE